MLEIKGTTISLTRGDSMRVHIDLKYRNGDPYVETSGDSIRFALKRRYKDETVLIEKAIPTDTLMLSLDPEDTKPLSFGDYVYDIEMTHADGFVDTFIDKATFKITEEVE